jgi:kumamolisin
MSVFLGAPALGPLVCRPYVKRWDLPRALSPAPLVANGPNANGTWKVRNLCAAYGFPTHLPGRGRIAIVELGGGWLQSDLDIFFSRNALPGPAVTDISVDSTVNSPGADPDADGEVALDIEVAGDAFAYATGVPAEIRVYWAADIAPALVRIAADGWADVISISWGSDEANWPPAQIAALRAAIAACTAAGMIICAAAGDNDSSDGGPTPANVDLPSSDPEVIACGGTSKTAQAEVVWNNNPGNTNGEGTGGGFSTLYGEQPWQIGAPSPPLGLGRMVPDLTANADPETGYDVVIAGQDTAIGGTSAVAPLFAGLFAACGSKPGWVTERLWADPGAFVDITVGDNGFYHALRGPDACSGLGAPVGARIAALLAKP